MIPCTIRSEPIRRAIEHVLRIVEQHGKDWPRLRRRVRGFAYLPDEDEDGQTVGQWVVDEAEAARVGPHGDDPRTWGRGDGHYHAGGSIYLSRRAGRLPRPRLVALIAHECGHAATREQEFRRRDGLDGEWASELCADRHAFRWGFEREIRADAPHRDFGHHAVLPGACISLGEDVFLVDRNFYLRPAGKRRRSEFMRAAAPIPARLRKGAR